MTFLLQEIHGFRTEFRQVVDLPPFYKEERVEVDNADTIMQRLDEMTKQFIVEFQKLGNRMDRLESRMDRLENRVDTEFSGVNERLDRMQSQMNTLERHVYDLNTMVRTLAKQYGDLHLDVAVLRQRV